MKKIKIGLTGLMHNNFPGDKELAFKKARIGLEELSQKLGYELYVVNNNIITEEDAIAAKKELELEQIDLLLVLNVQFASGKIISILSELPVFLGLWSIPEPSKKGPLPLNSFCGMNMNASILKEYLRKEKFKWFYGYTDSELFINRFKITIQALQVIKNIQETEVALIGGIAYGFDDQYYDERKIYERFQIKVNNYLEFGDLKQRVLSYKDPELEDIKTEILNSACCISTLASKTIDNTARVIKALIDIKNEMDLSGIALDCWPRFRQELDMVPCAAIGYLNEKGIVTACEGDVYGLISMYILQQLSNLPTLLMDLVDFDEEDQSLLFWHCGIGNQSLAYQGRISLSSHSNPAVIKGKGVIKHAPVADMIYKPGFATIARITNNCNSFFLLNGEFFNPGKPSFDGSRGWLNHLHYNQEFIKVRDVINTIMTNGVQHHYAITLGNKAEEMLETFTWLGVKPLPKIEYRDYLL